MRTIIRASVGSCLFLSAVLPSAAIAADRASGHSIQVSYADLDIRKDSDLRRLDSRLRNAASRLCFEGGEAVVSDSSSMRQCVNATVAGVKPQVDRVIAQRGAGNALAAAAVVVTLP